MSRKVIVPEINAKCFRCERTVIIKYVLPKKRYSYKNDWEFWTREKGSKKICDKCLRSFYLDEKPLFWEKVKDLNKRQLLSNYINNKTI